MIVGTSPAMQQLMKIVVKVARTDANILITGETEQEKKCWHRKYTGFPHERNILW